MFLINPYPFTDKIPVSVSISQKAASNLSASVFVRGEDVVFSVSVHDPSKYLKTADAVDYIWDFKDGNQLVTHSNVATHAYSAVGKVNVKLTVEAAIKIPCPPPTPMSVTSPQTTGTHSSHTLHFRGYYRYRNLEEGMYIVHTIMSFTCTVLLPHMPGIRYAPLGNGAWFLD